MPNTFDWVEIRIRNTAEAAHFYKGVFGWKITGRDIADGSDVWIFDTGAEPRVQNLRRGGLWSRAVGEPLGVVVYVVVEDIEAMLRKVVELGGSVVTPRVPQGTAHRACFKDPSGNVLGLWEEPTG